MASQKDRGKKKPLDVAGSALFNVKKKERKKKDWNIHTKNTHSPPACYSVVDPH